MAPKPLTYRTRDLVQALRGAREAGLSIKTLEIDKCGKITVQMGAPGVDPEPESDKGDDEEWQAKRKEWEEKAE